MISCRVPGSPPTPPLSARKQFPYFDISSRQAAEVWLRAVTFNSVLMSVLAGKFSRGWGKPSRLPFWVSFSPSWGGSTAEDCLFVAHKLTLWISLQLFISPNSDSLFFSTKSSVIFLFSAQLEKLVLSDLDSPISLFFFSPGHSVSYSKRHWRNDLGLSSWKTEVLCADILLGSPLRLNTS